jgi:hypothetical protein
MSDERKKVEPKPIVKAEPKKREVSVKKEVVKVEPKKPVVKETPKPEEPKPEEPKPEEPKPKKSENKYVRLALDAKGDERNEIVEKVKRGELKLAFYATDNDKGYHYYLVIKK